MPVGPGRNNTGSTNVNQTQGEFIDYEDVTDEK